MMRAILLGILVCLSACSASKVVESALPTNERILIRGAIDDVSRDDVADLSRKVPPDGAPKLASVTPKMREQLPGPPLEISLAAANWRSNGTERFLHAVYEVHGRNGWALVDATVQSQAGRSILTGIYVAPTPGDPEKLNAFSLQGMTFGKILILTAMIAAIAVTLAALLRIWRTRLFRNRWLWTIGVLIGLTTLRMNWSTGALVFQPISIALFSAGAVKQPVYAPWMMSVSIPLFAFIALFRGRNADRDDASNDAGAHLVET